MSSLISDKPVTGNGMQPYRPSCGKFTFNSVNANLVRTIEKLYDKATSEVQMIGRMAHKNSRN